MQEHLTSPSLANPDVLVRRMVQCAHNRDGLPEIIVGMNFLVASGLSWSDVVFHGRPQHLWALISTLVLFCLFCGSASWTIRRIRERFLLPWVGYVQIRRSSRTAKAVSVVSAFVIAVVALVLLRKIHLQHPKIWLLPMEGIMIGGFQIIVGRLPRFWITGSLTAVAGFALASTSWSFELCTALFFVLAGILELLAGGITLLWLLQKRTNAGV